MAKQKSKKVKTLPENTVPQVEAVPAKEQPARPAVSGESSAPVVPKKRVRIRKKATKHLSVAVLCTNPITRRFI